MSPTLLLLLLKEKNLKNNKSSLSQYRHLYPFLLKNYTLFSLYIPESKTQFFKLQANKVVKKVQVIGNFFQVVRPSWLG